MTDERRAKKGDRFLQESESAHDDALRNLQEDVRLAEKFDELEKQGGKRDPFFYTLRRKRTDAGALKVDTAPSAAGTTEAASEAPPLVSPSAIELREQPPAPDRARRGAFVVAALLLAGVGLAIAFAVGRDGSDGSGASATKSTTETSATTQAGAQPSTVRTTPTAPPSQPAPSIELSAPPRSAEPTPSVTPPSAQPRPTTPPSSAPTVSPPPTTSSSPLGKPPVY